MLEPRCLVDLDRPQPANNNMAHTDDPRLPFRWAFVPVESAHDKSIHWTWRAYDQAGNVLMQSKDAFESRLECVEDAMANGYRQKP